MSLPSITARGRNGGGDIRPNSYALVLAARSLLALGRGDRDASGLVAQSAGARVLHWIADRRTRVLDWTAWYDGRTLWLNIFGTENLRQCLDYTTSLFPGYDRNLGAFCMVWALGQAVDILPFIRRWNEALSPRRVVLAGHSLGGGVAHVLGCLVRNHLTTSVEPPPATGYFPPVERLFQRNGQFAYHPLDWFRDDGATVYQPTQQRVEVLTFGEPRTIGGGAEFRPDVHLRVIGTGQLNVQGRMLRPAATLPEEIGMATYRTVSPRGVLGQAARVAASDVLPVLSGRSNDVGTDVVADMPPNLLVAPVAGALASIPGLRKITIKIGLDVTPIHYGTPFFIRTDGSYVSNPNNGLGRFVNELAGSLVQAAAWLTDQMPEGWLELHYIANTYLPAAESQFAINGVHDQSLPNGGETVADDIYLQDDMRRRRLLREAEIRAQTEEGIRIRQFNEANPASTQPLPPPPMSEPASQPQRLQQVQQFLAARSANSRSRAEGRGGPYGDEVNATQVALDRSCTWWQFYMWVQHAIGATGLSGFGNLLTNLVQPWAFDRLSPNLYLLSPTDYVPGGVRQQVVPIPPAYVPPVQVVGQPAELARIRAQAVSRRSQRQLDGAD